MIELINLAGDIVASDVFEKDALESVIRKNM